MIANSTKIMLSSISLFVAILMAMLFNILLLLLRPSSTSLSCCAQEKKSQIYAHKIFERKCEN